MTKLLIPKPITKGKMKYETAYLLLVALVWLRLSVVSYTFSLLEKVAPVASSSFEILKIFIYVIVSILAIPYIKGRIKWRDIFFLLIIGLVYLINIDFYPNTSEYLCDNFIYIFLINFLTYYVGLSLDSDEFIEFIYKCSKIAILSFLLYFLIFGFTPEAGRANMENMGLAYRILPHSCILILYSFREKKLYDILLSLISAILILACGVRGALLSLIAFIIVYVVFFIRLKFSTILLGGSALIICFIEYRRIIELLTNFMNMFGFSTRVLERLVDRTTLVDEPRRRITIWMLDKLQERPYFGYGIAGDRNLVADVAYAHSFWLEMWVSYGWIMGTLIMIFIALVVLKSIVKSNPLQKGFIFAMIFGGGAFKLIVSSSYLLEFEFFMLIGYCVRICRNKKATKDYNNLIK